MASSRPVTTADRSPTVAGRFISHLVTAHSSSTQEATLTASTSSSAQPYTSTETRSAGHSAMMTSRMIEVVDVSAWMCGEGDTIYFLSIGAYFLAASAAALAAAARARMTPITWPFA